MPRAQYTFRERAHGARGASDARRGDHADHRAPDWPGIYSVAISGSIVVAGASAPFGGAAHLYELTAGGWVEKYKLVPDDAATLQEFGNAVALGGAYALVGCWEDDEHGTNAGAAYVFDLASGRQHAKLTPAEGELGRLVQARPAFGELRREEGETGAGELPSGPARSVCPMAELR